MGVKGFHHGFCASLFCGFRERETKEMRERDSGTGKNLNGPLD